MGIYFKKVIYAAVWIIRTTIQGQKKREEKRRSGI